MSDREACADDLPDLASMMAASPLLRRYQTTYASALASLEDGMRQGDLLLVAGSVGERPRGLAWVHRLRGFGGVAYLRLLLVAEGAQGQKVGERLLEDVEQRVAAWSRHLLLLSTEDNLGARRFYERLGYRKAGQLERLVLADADEVLYQKVLTSPVVVV